MAIMEFDKHEFRDQLTNHIEYINPVSTAKVKAVLTFYCACTVLIPCF